MDIIYYLFGPRLYMDYDANAEEMYSLAVLEKIGDYLLTLVLLLLKVILYSSAIIGSVLYKRGWIFEELCPTCIKITAVTALLLVLSICFRGIGRYQSGSYNKLISALKHVKLSSETQEDANPLEMFDFDFRWWPVDFDVRSIKADHPTRPPTLCECNVGILNCLQYVAAYIFVHCIGIHLLYPGTIFLLQTYIRPNLVEGRAEIILKRNGHRYKIRTADRNEIDTIFIDNRERSRNGGTLIISCEGNMSFYEIGVVNSNLARNYSLVGWNHPGFEGSTGCPFPKQEFYAIDAVIKFAIHKLHFDEADIMLYGWSIGGYSAVTGASKYQNLKGIILDGTFDDIAHLASKIVPNIFKEFVTFAVRCHCNLHSSELLKRYKGPVLIIRRLYDETISPNSRLESNRSNNLALELLRYRYPNIFRESQVLLLNRILSRPLYLNNLKPEENAECWTRLLNHVAIEGKDYPMTIGDDYTEHMRNQMANFLLRKYCRDFKSSHCPPLNPEYFQIPWDGFTRQAN